MANSLFIANTEADHYQLIKLWQLRLAFNNKSNKQEVTSMFKAPDRTLTGTRHLKKKKKEKRKTEKGFYFKQ